MSPAPDAEALLIDEAADTLADIAAGRGGELRRSEAAALTVALAELRSRRADDEKLRAGLTGILYATVDTAAPTKLASRAALGRIARALLDIERAGVPMAPVDTAWREILTRLAAKTDS